MEDIIFNFVQNIIDSEFILLLVRFFIFGIIMLSLKTITENLVGYILFILDPHICIGTPIEVYGIKGRIKEASFFTITIETMESFIRIPFKDWRSSRYIILKDQLHVHNND